MRTWGEGHGDQADSKPAGRRSIRLRPVDSNPCYGIRKFGIGFNSLMAKLGP